MKCYIVGPVASGKSTLANQLSNLTNIPAFHLDEVLRFPDSTAPTGNRKRSEAEWSAIFEKILSLDQWIMEDTGREIFSHGLDLADEIVLLCPPKYIRYQRILTRWFRQHLGREYCIYTPNLAMLQAMFRWSRAYDAGSDGVKQRLHSYQNKITELKNQQELNLWLKKFT